MKNFCLDKISYLSANVVRNGVCVCECFLINLIGRYMPTIPKHANRCIYSDISNVKRFNMLKFDRHDCHYLLGMLTKFNIQIKHFVLLNLMIKSQITMLNKSWNNLMSPEIIRPESLKLFYGKYL